MSRKLHHTYHFYLILILNIFRLEYKKHIEIKPDFMCPEQTLILTPQCQMRCFESVHNLYILHLNPVFLE